jgi:hypothetical protein
VFKKGSCAAATSVSIWVCASRSGCRIVQTAIALGPVLSAAVTAGSIRFPRFRYREGRGGRDERSANVPKSAFSMTLIARVLC